MSIMRKSAVTLLYGDMDRDYADSTEASKFITTLLDAVIAIHKVHFMVTGNGSYAAHQALGDAYKDLHEGTDELAGSIMGCQQIGLTFSGINMLSSGAEVRKIYEYIETNRIMAGEESHIQNVVDEILDKLSKALFRLNRLS